MFSVLVFISTFLNIIYYRILASIKRMHLFPQCNLFVLRTIHVFRLIITYVMSSLVACVEFFSHIMSWSWVLSLYILVMLWTLLSRSCFISRFFLLFHNKESRQNCVLLLFHLYCLQKNIYHTPIYFWPFWAEMFYEPWSMDAVIQLKSSKVSLIIQVILGMHRNNLHTSVCSSIMYILITNSWVVCCTNFNNRSCHILSFDYNYNILSGFWQLSVYMGIW